MGMSYGSLHYPVKHFIAMIKRIEVFEHDNYPRVSEYIKNWSNIITFSLQY